MAKQKNNIIVPLIVGGVVGVGLFLLWVQSKLQGQVMSVSEDI
jgi:hypothetical protein